MPIVVEAKNEQDYTQWVSGRKTLLAAAQDAAGKTFTKDELMAEGRKVYNANCAACHQADGQGVPGAFPPIAGSPIAKGPLDPHLDIVLRGKAGTAMLAYESQLNDVKLAAVMTYERNAFGNATGDLVQPAQIKAARK